MRLNARMAAIGAALAVAIWFLTTPLSGRQADEEKVAKEIREILFKLADAIEKNNAAETSKQTEALKKYDLLPIMQQMKLRANGGIGIGSPGTVTPDGIEAKLIGMARKPLPAGELNKAGPDLARAAYIMAAIAEVTKSKSPVKTKMGEKDPKDWAKWTEDMGKFARELAKASQAKDAAQVKAAATNLNSTCNNCHGVFRD
ncbi:MAG TPA: cytochrome c [Gemmataceae bacterium]|nr:cytochrome c [Gemmataceae bacterium]